MTARHRGPLFQQVAAPRTNGPTAGEAHLVHRAPRRAAFSLLELLLVVAIIGALTALLLPAIQSSRAAAHRTQCADNLRNVGIALLSFHESEGAFPFGNDGRDNLGHAWSSRILPQLGYPKIASQIDFSKSWDDEGGNSQVGQVIIPVYRCPAATERFPGQMDYGGIIGSTLTGLPWGVGPYEAFGSGTLIPWSPKQPNPVKIASITDGTSRTMAVSEAVDRAGLPAGQWACGANAFSVSSPISHHTSASGIYSVHLGGAYALFVDGSVHFLADGLSDHVLGALATRNADDHIAAAGIPD